MKTEFVAQNSAYFESEQFRRRSVVMSCCCLKGGSLACDRMQTARQLTPMVQARIKLCAEAKNTHIRVCLWECQACDICSAAYPSMKITLSLTRNHTFRHFVLFVVTSRLLSRVFSLTLRVASPSYSSDHLCVAESIHFVLSRDELLSFTIRVKHSKRTVH